MKEAQGTVTPPFARLSLSSSSRILTFGSAIIESTLKPGTGSASVSVSVSWMFAVLKRPMLPPEQVRPSRGRLLLERVTDEPVRRDHRTTRGRVRGVGAIGKRLHAMRQWHLRSGGEFMQLPH